MKRIYGRVKERGDKATEIIVMAAESLHSKSNRITQSKHKKNVALRLIQLDNMQSNGVE